VFSWSGIVFNAAEDLFKLLALRRIVHDVCPFILIGTAEVEDDVEGVPRRVLFAAATALNNSPLLPRLFPFDDDDDPSPDPLSADCGPWELGFGLQVPRTFELDDDTTATAASLATAALSTRFRNGLGRFSSSAKSYSGEGWLLGTGIGRDLATVTAAARLELLLDGRKCGCGSGFAWVCPLDVDGLLSLILLSSAGSEEDVAA